MNKVKIGAKVVGNGEPCFIIAEAGVNHNGELKLAKELIDVASAAGADAVKFQTFKADELVLKDVEKADYQKKATSDGTQFEMIKTLELSKEDFQTLFQYAKSKGIMFLSSPFDVASADILAGLGVPAFKIASGEITNFPLLKHVARFGKPVILSTGMAVLQEIEDAIKVIKAEGLHEIVILHCITSYPANIEDLNLRAIETLRSTFHLPVGFSDHSLGINAPIAAVSLDACVIEKHFTLDKTLAGPDHQASLAPDELKEMINLTRQFQVALQERELGPTDVEKEIKRIVRKSIVSLQDIQKGETLTDSMLAIKRPGTGIEPKHWDEIIGKKATQFIKKDEVLNWDMIE